MKLQKPQLENLQKAKSDYEALKGNLAHTVLEESAIKAKKLRVEQAFLEALKKFEALQGEVIREHGEGVGIDLVTGIVTKPKADA